MHIVTTKRYSLIRGVNSFILLVNTKQILLFFLLFIEYTHTYSHTLTHMLAIVSLE